MRQFSIARTVVVLGAVTALAWGTGAIPGVTSSASAHAAVLQQTTAADRTREAQDEAAERQLERHEEARERAREIIEQGRETFAFGD